MQVFDFVRNDNRHGAVVSVAGSGKSTTLEECCAVVPPHKKTLVLSFNTDIQLEMYERISKRALRCEVRTYNSYCNTLLKRHELIPPKFNEDKTVDILKRSVYKDRFWELQYSIKRAVSILKNKAVFAEEDIEALVEKEDICDSDNFAAIAADIFRQSVDYTREIDYDDQKYYAIKNNWRVPKVDYLFIDEYQDTCPIEAMLVDRFIASGTRVIIVGDHDQAIYSFKGTQADSIRKFIAKYDAVELPLSTCFRCSQAVIKEAQKTVPRIEAASFAVEGSVGTVTRAQFFDKVQLDDLILGRTNSTLVSSCIQFFKYNKNAYIEGKEVTAGLFAYIGRVSGNDGEMDIDVFEERMFEDYKKTSELLIACKKVNLLNELRDWFECVSMLADDPHLFTVGELRYKAYNLFKVSKTEKYRHMTIHKSKGLEGVKGANVYLLDPENLGELPEDKRLLYVATTRSKMGGFYYVRG